MNKKELLSAAFVALILVSIVLNGQVLRVAQANFEPHPNVFIQSDGTVNGTDKILRVGDNYVLTADGDLYIWVSRNNAVLDGAGHTIYAISVSQTNNVTIKNFKTTFSDVAGYGIGLDYASGNTVTGNEITNNLNQGGVGISIGSVNNTISQNNITNCQRGIRVDTLSGNKILNNYITNGYVGIQVLETFSNDSGIEIIGNTIANNGPGYQSWGLWTGISMTGSLIYHNNFINNSNGLDGEQVRFMVASDYNDPRLFSMWHAAGPNNLDNGVEGNYWSNYIVKYPGATDMNNTGTGSISYRINENNVDRHPLLAPFKTPALPPWSTSIKLPSPTTQPNGQPSQSPSETSMPPSTQLPGFLGTNLPMENVYVVTAVVVIAIAGLAVVALRYREGPN
jgi:parallel beta-helix repeat protein